LSTERPKRAIFWAVLVGLVVVVPFVTLEFVVRVAGIRTSDDPYLHFGRVSSFFQQVEVDGKPQVKVAHRDIYRSQPRSFSPEKKPNTFRIFTLGGSASAGWPHPQTEGYSDYLEQALQRAYPERVIEVVNLGAHAYAAYRVHLILDEVASYDPDMVIIYSGNNEFLEKRTYAITRSGLQHWLAASANHSVVYRVLRGSSLGTLLFPGNTIADSTRQHVAYEQWSKIEQLPLPLRQIPEQLDMVREHYEYSIRSMVELAENEGVSVILLTVPVNLRDWQPNVSANRVTGELLVEFEYHLRAGRGALLRGDDETAVDALRRAIAVDPSHAGAHYHLGRALESLEDHSGASRSYQSAVDLDANPFRILSMLNESVRELGRSHPGVDLIDAEAEFRAASAPYAPGFDLFLDYVHPTRRGNLILAERAFDRIVAGGAIADRPAFSDFVHDPDQGASGQAPYSEETDYRMRVALLRLFAAMHQYETVVEEARYLVETPGALDSLSPEPEIVRRAHAVFPDVVDMQRRQALGEEVPAEEVDEVNARLVNFYRTSFRNREEFEEEIGAE